MPKKRRFPVKRTEWKKPRYKKPTGKSKPTEQLLGESKNALLHDLPRLHAFVHTRRAWEVMENFTVPELFHAGIRPRVLIGITRVTLIPYYYPEKLPHSPTATTVEHSKHTALRALFPFGVPAELQLLMRQRIPTPTLFEEIVAWSLLNAGVASERLGIDISTEALHTVLSHHPAYKRNIPPK